MSDCACVYVDIDEGYDESGEEVCVAGTERKCVECRRQIDVGEKYIEDWGAYSEGYDENDEEILGDVEIHTTCIDCFSVREEFFCIGWWYTRVWELLEEHLGEVVMYGDGLRSSCLTGLTVRAREMVCDIIEEIWAEMDADEEEDEQQ